MESKGKCTSVGTAKMKSLKERSLEDFFDSDAETFAKFLVGKTIKVIDTDVEGAPVPVEGIVRREENSMQNELTDEQEKTDEFTSTNWQVSIMSANMHREYTYCVLDFTYPDGRPYQEQKRAMRGESGIEHSEKNVTMTIKDYDDQQGEAAQMYKERHFLGGCAAAQGTIAQGIVQMQDKRVSVWWPGERLWFSGVVAQTTSKNKALDIEYDDGEYWSQKVYTGMVWRLEATEDTIENGEAAFKRATETRAKSAAAKPGEGGSKKKSVPGGKVGKDTRKRKVSAKNEYNAASEAVVLDTNTIRVTKDQDNMMRLIDNTLPQMKKASKHCKVEQPTPECAIFTIEDRPKNVKNIVNVVATTDNVLAASLFLEDGVWLLDWSLEPKSSV